MGRNRKAWFGGSWPPVRDALHNEPNESSIVKQRIFCPGLLVCEGALPDLGEVETLAAAPPPPPPLLDELLEEVFLRLPPDEPHHLARASAVCKPWRRLIAGRGFRRRYLKFHGAPPVLGLIHNGGRSDARLVPTSAASRRFRPRGLFAVDCRHGRALFVRSGRQELIVALQARKGLLLVWDPVTAYQTRVPPPNMRYTSGFGAAVLCAAQGCDHSGCQGGPFLVAVVAVGQDPEICARLYSSETGTWSQVTSVHHPHPLCSKLMRSILVGDALCFTSVSNQIIEYRLGTRRLSLIDLPPEPEGIPGRLVMAQDGGLGFAKSDGATLTLWSRAASPNGALGWAKHRVVNLETLLPRGALSSETMQWKQLVQARGNEVVFQLFGKA
ncbi:hypothetical protein BRADI_1g58956v3 [Brachypodium distachyon]|uniref:F-box domain-containing protein n=1 Tax=Brachypodium distachyon TaxID=15368 RepID=A0A0Q3HF28_BRADI|nr:hypothetical protein BRADI_1g58956v3 [Brachypodium distachyon]